MNAAQALVQALVKEGVDTVFGYPGGAILPHLLPELQARC